MDAVILAGGYGTRMWPITNDTPKMLFPLGRATVLDRLLAEIAGCDRIGDVYLSTNRRFADTFETHIASTGGDVTISVEESTGEGDKLGVVKAFEQLVEREGLDDDTLVVAGDNVFGFDFEAFVDEFVLSDSPILAAHDVGSIDRARKYGVLEVENGSVKSLVEKPADPLGTLVSVGCYGLPSATLSQLSTYLDSGSNRDQIGWFLQWLVDRTDVRAYQFDDPWFDVGSLESYLEAVSWSLKGRHHVADDARVTRSALDENTLVATDGVVEHAKCQSSVIFSGASVRNSEIRNAVVGPGATVEQQTVSHGLVGAGQAIPGDVPSKKKQLSGTNTERNA